MKVTVTYEVDVEHLGTDAIEWQRRARQELQGLQESSECGLVFTSLKVKPGIEALQAARAADRSAGRDVIPPEGRRPVTKQKRVWKKKVTKLKRKVKK